MVAWAVLKEKALDSRSLTVSGLGNDECVEESGGCTCPYTLELAYGGGVGALLSAGNRSHCRPGIGYQDRRSKLIVAAHRHGLLDQYPNGWSQIGGCGFRDDITTLEFRLREWL